MMGAGKTTVGKTLARLTGRSFVDTDDLISKTYGAISDIFKNHGEQYFRNLEKQTAKELSKKGGMIIATGGGFVICQDNVNLLKEQGKIVYLSAEEETLYSRLATDKDRPLLQTGDLREKIHSLILSRAPVYEKVADLVVAVDNKTAEEIAKEIIERVIK
jgi:shikimate kinase